MKLIKLVTYAILFILLFSCKHTTESFVIDGSSEEIDFSNFHFKYFDFDSVHIVSNDNFYLDRMSVKEIIVYEQLKDTIALYCKAKPTYTMVDSVYKMCFEIPIKASASVVNYNIYFNMLENKYVQVDTTITYFTPPTADATFEFALTDIPDWRPTDSFQISGSYPYQDIDAFDVAENDNYWVFRVRDYFFGWDRSDNTTHYYDVYKERPSNGKNYLSKPKSPWGEDVAYYNNMLYFDFEISVRKMNYNDSTYTYFFNYIKNPDALPGYNSYYPGRIAVDSNNVYILVGAHETEQTSSVGWIIVLDHDGNFIKSIRWKTRTAQNDIEVYNNILYGYLRSTHEIIRYDLIQEEFLSSIPAPDNYLCCGFRIVFDRLYYIDWGYSQEKGQYGPEVMLSVPFSLVVNNE